MEMNRMCVSSVDESRNGRRHARGLGGWSLLRDALRCRLGRLLPVGLPLYARILLFSAVGR